MSAHPRTALDERIAELAAQYRPLAEAILREAEDDLVRDAMS